MDNYSNKRILIIGGAGFIGSHYWGYVLLSFSQYISPYQTIKTPLSTKQPYPIANPAVLLN